MKCPYCGHPESKVIDSRPADENASIRRRRECLSCAKRFTTYETVESLPMVVVKKDGSRQSFDRRKVLGGMIRACEKRPVPLAELEKIAEEMRQIAGIQVEVLSADLSTMEGALAVAERVGSPERPIGLLVNNAGFGLGQDFVGGSLNRELQGLNTMVRAVLITCHAAADAMTRRGYGGILNVASMTALTAQGSYSAHKAWVKTFTEGLAARLEGTGVTVTAVCPGLVHTEFHERSNVDSTQWPDVAFSSPNVVARAAIDGVRRGAVIVTPTLRYRAAAAILRLAPRSLIRRFAGPGLSGRGE